MSFYLLPYHLITKSNFEEALAQYDAIEQELKLLSEQMKPLLEKQSQFMMAQSKMEIDFLIPKISITEVNSVERKTGVVSKHLRAHATYFYNQDKNRFNIFIGPSEAFRNGKNDVNVLEIVKVKAYNYLKKAHPDIFI
jgi:predicted nuclease with TOPRIM domain